MLGALQINAWGAALWAAARNKGEERGEEGQRNDFIDETLVKNAGNYMLQEQLAMMSYKKKNHLQAMDSWRPYHANY